MLENIPIPAILRPYIGGYRYSRLQLQFPTRSISYISQIKRRKTLLAVVSAVILLIIIFPYYALPRHKGVPNSSPYSESSCPITPPKEIYIPTNSSRFDWSKVSTKHPVPNFMRLSDATPLQLPPVQHNFSLPSHLALSTREYRQAQVKAVFQKAWNSYKERAWLQDELAPVSGTSKNTFGGWGATLVDSLDTLYIMDLYDEFEDAVAAAVNISFAPDTSSLEKVNIFETTIRYLGGFLSAYDLTSCKDNRLLDKAVEVGHMIYASFDTVNRMPCTRWDPRAAERGEDQGAANNAIIAEFGTSSLEFTRLSYLTGDMRWFDAMQRLTNEMDRQQNNTKLPGMWPIGINAEAPDLTVGTSFGFGAMSDSAYEYLPKMYSLLSGVDPAPQYRRLTITFMETAMQNLFYRPMVPDNSDTRVPGTINLDQFTLEKSLDGGFQHLACFTGGMFALAGKLFGRSDQVTLGRQITEACIWAYRNSLNGIMPEISHLYPCPDQRTCFWNEATWQGAAQPSRPPGFTSIDDPKYILRPEAIESVFYLYRISGDERLQDAAWDMFQAVSNHTQTIFANAAIKDVTIENIEHDDSMESFWLGETLKYYYLIFSDPSLVSLDDFVFNTEAHPFRRPGR
jgi:mannosyl-oligosaccharide alpha-1,2-mannosidase